MRVRTSSLASLGQSAGYVRWGLTTRDSVRQVTPGTQLPGLEAKAPLRSF